MMVLYPMAAQAPSFLAAYPREDVKGALMNYIEWLYRSITSLRTASLAELWRFARDLVLTIQRWADDLDDMSGEERMELAVDVAWDFIVTRGGYEALRDRLTAELDRILPGLIARTLVRWLFNERLAKALIRFVLELAVREMKDGFTRDSETR